MRTYFAIFAVAVLLTSSFIFIIGDDQNDTTISAASTVPDSYHNATLHLNLTQKGGLPAVGFKVELRESMYYTYTNLGFADSQGKLTISVNFQLLGTTDLRVYDLDSKAVYYERIKIGPHEEKYMDIEVGDPLVLFNNLSGMVRNAYSDEPVPNFSFTLRGNDEYMLPIQETVTSDSLGRYSIDLPNSSTSFTIYAFNHPDFENLGVDIYLEAGKSDHPIDIFLRPKYLPQQPAHFRIVDADSGNYFVNGSIYIDGYEDPNLGAFYSKTISTPDPSSGWFNTTLDHGEYRLVWTSKPGNGDLEFGFTHYFNVNDTETTKEIPVELPDLIDLEVNVWNGTSPLSTTNLLWNDNSDEISMKTFVNTNSSGIARLKIPADRKIYLEALRSGYVYRTIEIDGSTLSPPYEMNITLEESIRPARYANVPIRVVDDITGAGIPAARVTRYSHYELGSHHTSYSCNETGEYEAKISLLSALYDYTHFVFMARTTLGEGVTSDIILVEGDNPEVVIRVIREDLAGPFIRTHFYVKDESGTPIPYLFIYAKMEGDIDSVWTYLISDQDGRVQLIGPPGDYFFSIPESWKHRRSLWAFDGNTYQVTEPGLIGNLTAYPSQPLDTYWGSIKDSQTMDGLEGVRVQALSFKDLGLTRNGVGDEGESRIDPYLYGMVSGSDETGFFRFDGMGSIEIDLSKIGYFDQRLEIEQPARDIQMDDMFMDPIPAYTTWVNGTLVDENGDPIEGVIMVYDADHDDYILHESTVNETGEFSFEMYPGSFTFWLINDTLEDNIDISVEPEGIEDLKLALIPSSEVWGSVEDWGGEPLEGINITLINPDINEPGKWVLTNEFGEFSFEVPPGNYYFVVEGTELYDDYLGTTFETNGWDDEYFEITLGNRSVADIVGKVLGEAGPLVDGVPDSIVSLMQDGIEVENAITDSTGGYEFTDVDHGMNYSISATPPIEWMSVVDMRSGYLMNLTLNITVSGAQVGVDIMLPFEEHQPPGYLEFMDHLPVGENVSLDEDLIVRFSRPINISTFIQAFNIEPALDVNFTLNIDGDAVIMTHAPFEPNTTYEIIIAGTVLSVDGWPLLDLEGVTWNFTTSDDLSSWKILSVDVTVGPDKNVSISVNGLDNMSLYVVVSNLGSYQMMPTGLPGTYSLVIDGENLEWDMMYFYHFSDQEDGEDLSIGFSGNFTTPSDPDPEWGLTSSLVIAEEDGSISIEAIGLANQTVWVNILGIGWYQLEEDEEGVYKVVVPAGDLEWNTQYSVMFSDDEEGGDIVPDHSVFIRTIEEPGIGDDDDDDDTSLFGSSNLFAVGCCSVILLLIIIIIVIVIVTKKRSKEESWDEE